MNAGLRARQRKEGKGKLRKKIIYLHTSQKTRRIRGESRRKKEFGISLNSEEQFQKKNSSDTKVRDERVTLVRGQKKGLAQGWGSQRDNNYYSKVSV